MKKRHLDTHWMKECWLSVIVSVSIDQNTTYWYYKETTVKCLYYTLYDRNINLNPNKRVFYPYIHTQDVFHDHYVAHVSPYKNNPSLSSHTSFDVYFSIVTTTVTVTRLYFLENLRVFWNKIKIKPPFYQLKSRKYSNLQMIIPALN